MLLCLCPGFAHESLVRRSEAKEMILCAPCEFFSLASSSKQEIKLSIASKCHDTSIALHFYSF